MSTFVVHADTNENFDAFEIETTIFAALCQLTQIVDQPIDWLEVANLVLLGCIVMDDLGTVRGRYSR